MLYSQAALGVAINSHSGARMRSNAAHMAMAVVPAVKMALEKAGIGIGDVKAIKTHNPFAANDIYMAQEMDIDVNGFNNYGSSLIFGHPQAPTAGRLIWL